MNESKIETPRFRLAERVRVVASGRTGAVCAYEVRPGREPRYYIRGEERPWESWHGESELVAS